MPNPWMPGLRHDPGRGAGYNAGQNDMKMAVDHDTGGSNSYEICKWGRDGYRTGLCQILLPKVGIPWQFMEIDAIAYHAGSSAYGDYNPYGPGYEVERFQGEDLTPDQRFWLGEINKWTANEWGLPNSHYWGPQFPWWGADFNGSVNHRDIHPNPDGLSRPEWDSLGGEQEEPPPPPPQEGEMQVVQMQGPFGPIARLVTSTGVVLAQWSGTPNGFGVLDAAVQHMPTNTPYRIIRDSDQALKFIKWSDAATKAAGL